MAEELAFTLINPYTIGKSRTGNVISRFLSRTGMELVAARMFGPGRELAERYAELTRSFHLNLAAMGLLAFVVGVFLTYNALAFSYTDRAELIRKLEPTRSHDARYWQLAGEVHSALGRHADARRDYARALTLRPRDSRLVRQVALAARRAEGSSGWSAQWPR